jgi:CheY-like chemotaxis protein
MAEVLIVDDEPDARKPLGRLLEKVGHVVRVAPDGREALTQVLLKLPDVVVLDLLMPNMDGTDFLAALRSYRRLQRLPVVVLTALSNTPTLDRARALGAHSVLLKSKATFDDVRHAVEEAVRGAA